LKLEELKLKWEEEAFKMIYQSRDQTRIAKLGFGSNPPASYEDLRRLNQAGVYVLPGQERRNNIKESPLSTILLGAMVISVLSGMNAGEAC